MKNNRKLPLTCNSYDMYEVLSALQKAIRRQEPGLATIWAMELAMSGYYAHVASRLRVTAQEDIGPADPQAVVFANIALDRADAWKAKSDSAWRMAIANACYALAMANKSRVGDLLQAADATVVLEAPIVVVLVEEELELIPIESVAADRVLVLFGELGADLFFLF